jgi:hypothetical protein
MFSLDLVDIAAISSDDLLQAQPECAAVEKNKKISF